MLIYQWSEIQHRVRVLLFVLFSLVFASCQTQSLVNNSDQMMVMATTSIVGDVVRQVGGEYIQVEVLLPLGTDPHSFTPTPQDVSRLADASLLFINGAGLEEFLAPMVESAGAEAKTVDLSATIPLRGLDTADNQHGLSDPHTWMDPNNVVVWAQIVADTLTQLDPDHENGYRHNAELLQSDLVDLDEWVHAQIAQIPPDNRRLVTDHLVFGYFADRYGFFQIGSIIPGFSTLSEPSAQELAQLEDDIIALNVPAIFVGWSTNQDLADQIATDTNVQVIPVYTSSLSEAGGGADTYQDFIRYDVNAIVGGLR